MKVTKEIYKKAWKDLKKHYFITVIVIFLTSLILNDGYIFATDWTNLDDMITSHSVFENRRTNSEILYDFLYGQELITFLLIEWDNTISHIHWQI